MKLTTGYTALLTTALAITGTSAFGQAVISELGQRTLVVDAANGADTNTGVVGSPVKSLQAAINQAQINDRVGLPTKILVQPGVYRESLILGPGKTNATVTVEAAITGAAVISGSDVVTGWAHSSGSVYTHSYNVSLGGCPALAKMPPGATALAFRREMIFANGALLTQVLSRSAMHAGTFYVNTGSHLAYIWLANSANPNGYTIEVASRASTFQVAGRNNLVLRGLTFQHAASCLNQDSASVFSSSNVLVDGIKAQYNNFGGFHVSNSTNVTVQNSVGLHNGGVGFSAWKNKNLLYKNDESDYNNWRGAWGNFYDYGMGGFKFMLTHTGTFQNLFAFHNLAQGLWFDTDNKNITVDQVALVGNYYRNMQIELNQGPITVKNSLICGGSNGINILETQGLTISNSLFFNNGGIALSAQIYLAGKPGGRSMTDWETHASHNLVTKNVVLSGNQVADGDSSQHVFGTYVSGSDWSAFAYSLHSYNNRWYDKFKTTAFNTPGNKNVNLSGWRSKTGQDSSSSWSLSSSLMSTCSAQTSGRVQ